MPRVFVIGAPSGTGKTTLLQHLLGADSGLRFSVSHTTRERRSGEQEGRDYHFVARAAFEAAVRAGEFLEWAEVYGHLYGTHRSELERSRRDGVDLLLDIDIQGARSVREALPDAAMVLILPPSWEALEQRLRGRGTDSEESIQRRLAQARLQLEGYPVYNYVVVNDDLATGSASLSAIVQAERLRLAQQESRVRQLLGIEGEGR